MGKIFSIADVRSVHVPEKKSFSAVLYSIRTGLAAERSIVGAILFGSVLRGDSNIRSDIDCAVLYEKDRESRALATMHELSRVAASLHVSINWTPCDTVTARTRLHYFGPAFMRHLRVSADAGGVIEEDIISHFAASQSVENEVESYVAAKLYSLTESAAERATFSEERLLAFLKKTLEASIHVARKMLNYQGVLEGDSKREVQEQYRGVFPELAKDLEYLLQVDAGYTAELMRQLQYCNTGRYQDQLRILENEVPRVLEFLRGNLAQLG